MLPIYNYLTVFCTVAHIFADHSPVVIHGDEIAQVKQYEYLGVHVDNKLGWKVHVSGFALNSTSSCIFSMD